MERFFDDESDNDDESPFFKPFNDDDLEEGVFLDKSHLLDVMQMDLAQTGLYQNLIDQSVTVAEKHILWWFKTPGQKLKDIETIYKKLVELTEGDDGKDTPDAEL